MTVHISHHPGEGRSPVGEVVMTKRSARQSAFPNWTPAFAGEESVAVTPP